MAEAALDAARSSGLVAAGEPLLVMISGGADSTCLLDVALRLGAEVSALHVDYGLREASAADAEACRELCERLGVPLAVERVEVGPGNLQAAARDARYELAERLAAGDYATAHTASDQAETVLYRLAVSPGRRALLGMAARRGRLVRPLLEATAEDTRAYCRARGLAWREDESNADLRFARARVRHELLPVLRELNPAAERNIAATAALLRDEAEVLDALLADSADLTIAGLRALPPGLARLVIREAAGVAVSRRDCDRILAAGEEGTSTVDLPGGVRAVAEYGSLRFAREPDPAPPEPVALDVPGSASFGDWVVEARPGGDGEVAVDVDGPLIVRSWRHGDRMRPAGLGGSKSLQDLFTDRKVPRAERPLVPVVETEGRVVWVPGLAVDERFRAQPGAAARAVALTARRAP